MRRRRSSRHEAVLGSTAIHFAHTVPTAKSIHLGKAAEALLKSELALSAAWPTDDSPRLPPSLAEVETNIARLRVHEEWVESVTNAPTLVRAVIRHPITAFRALKAARTNASEPEDEAETTTTAALYEEAEKTIVNLQSITIVERQFDEELFWSETDEEDQYVRLVLRSTVHTISVGDATSKILLQPRVLLHQDGVVQVSVRLMIPDGQSPQNVTNASFSLTELLTTSRIPEVYTGGRGWEGGRWEEDPEADTRYRIFDSEEDSFSMRSWLDMVVDRVLEVIRGRADGPTYTYPMILTQAGTCCGDWEHNHRADIVHMAVRAFPSEEEALNLESGPDFSVRSVARLHATEGSLVRVALTPWQSTLKDLHHTLLYERVGLVYVRLHTLERRLAEFRTRGKVESTYREVLALEREVRGVHHRSGTTRRIAAHVYEDLGVPALLTSLRESVGMLGERASTRASVRSARASNRLAFVAIVVAVITAIPAVPDILDLLEGLRAADPEGGVWTVIQVLVTSPLLLPALILGTAAGYVGWFLFDVTLRVIRILMKIRKGGYVSRTSGYDIHLDDPETD